MLTSATEGTLERPVSGYFKNNFNLTPSGLFFHA